MIQEQVTVTKDSIAADDPYEVILANIDFINDLLNEHVLYEEIHIDSLKSYYVDYYLAQINNGGFSQFVFNSNWDQTMINLISEGLKDMGASKNLKLFLKSAKMVSSMSKKNFDSFVGGEYFGNFLQINHLNKFDEKFYKLQDTECLIELNSNWIKSLPSLKVISTDEKDIELGRLVGMIPNKAERIKAAMEAEPRHKKIMRALCESVNQILEYETAADYKEFDGQKILAFHFMTNEGHHHMIEFKNKGVMFKGDTEEVVAKIDVTEQPGA